MGPEGKIVSCIALLAWTYFAYLLFSGSHTNESSNERETVVLEPEAESTIEKVALFVRHGERAPLKSSLRFNISSPEWPDGVGELTKLGKRRCYYLGKRLRNRYHPILTSYYSNDNLIALSTKVGRTISSVSLVLAGMYPPKDHQVWKEDIGWNPIPVFHQVAVAKYGTCPRFVYEHLKHPSEQMTRRLSNFVAALRNKGVYTPDHELGVYGVFDFLSVLESNEVKMDDWAVQLTRESYPTFAEWWRLITSQTFVQRQLASVFGDYLLDFMNDKKRILMFGVHDMNLFMLAGTLGFVLHPYPQPTASIAIEFHVRNNNSFVKAFFIPAFGAPMKPIEMTCGMICSLNNFKEMLLELKPDDYEALCNFIPEHIDPDVLDNYTSFFNLKKFLAPGISP